MRGSSPTSRWNEWVTAVTNAFGRAWAGQIGPEEAASLAHQMVSVELDKYYRGKK